MINKTLELQFDLLIQEFEYEKKYMFKKGLNVFYGDNQQGKSTIVNSIIMSLGGDDLFLKTKICPDKTWLHVNYYNNNDKNHHKFIFKNDLNAKKIKYRSFLKDNIGIALLARINNKFGLTEITPLDMLQFFYYSQEINDLDNRKSKLNNDAIDDIESYLISSKQNDEYMGFLVKKSKISKNITDLKQSIKVSQIINQKQETFKINENLEIEEILNNLEKKLDNICRDIQEVSTKRRNLKTLYNEYKIQTRYCDEFERISSTISKNINGCDISIWDLLKEHEILNPKFSLIEINEIESNILYCNDELKRLEEIQCSIKKGIEELPQLTILQLRKKQIRELLINHGEGPNKLNKLTNELKELELRIKDMMPSLKLSLNEFNEKIRMEMNSLDFDLSESGIGQQIEKIVKMRYYQYNCKFPIIIDGFMDGGTLDNKKKMIEYFIKNFKHQVILFCTIKDEDAFLEFLEMHKDINLEKIIR